VHAVTHILIVQPYRFPLIAVGARRNVISISAENSAPRHWQFGPMPEPCSWVRALSRHRASALGAGWQHTTAVDRVFPDGDFDMAKHVGSSFGLCCGRGIVNRVSSGFRLHVSNMGHRNPVLRLSPSGSVIITDSSYSIPETRRAPR
jgi:hypothetical protein